MHTARITDHPAWCLLQMELPCFADEEEDELWDCIGSPLCRSPAAPAAQLCYSSRADLPQACPLLSCACCALRRLFHHLDMLDHVYNCMCANAIRGEGHPEVGHATK